VIPIINRLAPSFQNVVMTQDWHGVGHTSFASSHPGSKPFETIRLSYGEQVLWPDHCVQGTADAALAADLHVPQAQLILRKGFHRDIDSYSAFKEADRTTPVLNRLGDGFLRRVDGTGCTRAGVRMLCGGRCLPCDRSQRLACGSVASDAEERRQAHSIDAN